MPSQGSLDEPELRVLLGALVTELGEAALARMNTFDVAAALAPRAAARAAAVGCVTPDDETLLRVANRWLSEWAVAEVVRRMEGDDEP
jgi:hypothetical protein